MVNLLTNPINLGTSPEYDINENNRVRMVNFISLYLLISNFLYAITAYSRGFEMIAEILLVFSVIFIIILLLQAFKRITIATNLLMFFVVIEIYFNSLAEVSIGFSKYYLFGACILTFILYKKKLTRLILYLLCSASFFLINYLQKHVTAFVAYDPTNYILDAFILFAGIYIFISFFIVQHEKNMEIILEQKLILNEKNSLLEKSNATKTKLLSIVGHDLRSPIQNILQLLEIYQSSGLTETEFKNYANTLKQSIGIQFESVNNLLQWAHNQLQGLKHRPVSFDINVLIAKIIAIHQLKLGSKKISLHFSDKELLFVFADIDHLEIVIRNILFNAIKFTPQNGNIHIRSEQKGGYAEIIIEDTGVGFSNELLSNAFEFEKIVSTPGTEQEKGTGIGLILSKELIELNEGNIAIHSQKDQGSTVTIRIPVSGS